MSCLARVGRLVSSDPMRSASHSARARSAGAIANFVPGTVLPALVALLADRHRDLILRARGVLGSGRSIEEHAAQHREQRIIGQSLAALGLRLRARLTQPCDRRRQDVVEPQRAGLEIGIRRVARTAALLPAGHELLDLEASLAARLREPFSLVLGRHDTDQLLDRREPELPGRERGGQRRQAFQLEGYADPVARRARCVVAASFEIVQQRHEAELAPDLHARGPHQPSCFFGIECSSLLPDPLQRTIDLAPVIPVASVEECSCVLVLVLVLVLRTIEQHLRDLRPSRERPLPREFSERRNALCAPNRVAARRKVVALEIRSHRASGRVLVEVFNAAAVRRRNAA
ncbi:MAG: hypothetical protein H0T89_01460 [Deltaproteobacteria bacterium]|nr:hypothetical protein [Deltaproteobacteria bacterium]